METLVHHFRLDAQEQQIKQLQGDVAEIKTTLKALEDNRAESREFRKMFLAWMQLQETSSDDSSSGSRSPSFLPDLPSDLQLDCGVDCHSDSLPSSPSVLDQLAAIISRSEERLCCSGHLVSTSHTDSRSLGYDSKLPTPDKSPGQGSLMPIRANWAINWAIYDIVYWELGSEPVMGHDVGLKTVVDLVYADLGRGVGQKVLVGLIFSLFKLHETGKAPFDRGNASLSRRLFNGMRLTFSATWHLWVVHGQARPPENAIGEASAGIVEVSCRSQS
ncbi:hypothetical protein Hanom_Chr05g00391171 [Helianthus anomalus]